MRLATGAPNTGQMLVFVPPHPLLSHWLAVARSSATPPQLFRAALAELGRLLVYEAVRDWLPVAAGEVETPGGARAACEVVDALQPLVLVPLLRAGPVLLEQAATCLPAHTTHHAWVVDGELALHALPPSLPPGARVLLADPVLATGAALCCVVDALLARGAAAANVRVVAAVCAPPALQRLAAAYPGLRVYAAMIDEGLGGDGQVLPGVGDAHARCFGTPSRFATRQGPEV